MLESLQPYSTALLWLMILVLAVCAQSFISTFVNLLKHKGTPAKTVDGNHKELPWRLYRVHQNSIENFSPFAASVFAGILVGASVSLVNLLAMVHVIARLIHWFIYAQGIGAVASGPRTISYVVGFVSNVLLALVVLFAIF